MDIFLLIQWILPALLSTVWCQVSEEISPSLALDPPVSHIVRRSAETSNIQEAVVLTGEQKQEIVEFHNSLRAIVKPSAEKIRKMTWDGELATMATNYSRKCIYKHSKDQERKHSRFSYVGENLYISTGIPMNADLLIRAVSKWYNETEDYKYKTRICKPGKRCGHYTQVAWGDTFKVGCGVTICKAVEVDGKNWRSATLFSCNYGPGGNEDRHPFIAGSSCSNCDKGDTCENNLCANPIRDKNFDSSGSVATWSEWSSWSACSKTCLGGYATRYRTCSSFVSTDCGSFFSEISSHSCSRNPCPSKSSGEWTNWGRWGSCSVSCGNGVQKKNRSCKDSKCSGRTKVTKQCSLIPCKTISETTAVNLQSTSGVGRPSQTLLIPTIYSIIKAFYFISHIVY